MITLDAIIGLAKAGERLTIEFKRELSSTQERDICKEIAAFATSLGGLIVIGIDNDAKIVGVTEAVKIRSKIENWISTEIDPLPIVDVTIHTHEGLDFVVVEVANGVAPFYAYRNVPYARVGTSSSKLNVASVIDLVRGRKVEDVLKAVEQTVSMAHSLASSAMSSAASAVSSATAAQYSAAPTIHGQGELATMNYFDLRERLFNELGAAPTISSIQSSLAAAQSMASYASVATAPAITGQGDLATMNLGQLQPMISAQIFAEVGASLQSNIMSLQAALGSLQALVNSQQATIAALSARIG